MITRSTQSILTAPSDGNSPPAMLFSPLPRIGADGTIYVGSLDRTLYARNPDGTKGREFTAEDGIESSPAIGPDGTIYFGSFDHFLYKVPGDGPLANAPWPMFRHALKHIGSVQAAPSAYPAVDL